MRGAPLDPCLLQDGAGIIPARAGSTMHKRFRCIPNKDHPRSCGEHGVGDGIEPCIPGSSPLVRGARTFCHLCTCQGRIIPARAGSTATVGTAVVPIEDHPRSCGEHPRVGIPRGKRPGSSPLVRGALKLAAMDGCVLGIIPARAGSTGGIYGRDMVLRGSSPLVRGAPSMA